MAKKFPTEFRNDVIAVAKQPDTTIAQTAKTFGISQSCLRHWLKTDEINNGDRPGITTKEATELRELKKRKRILEQENEILRRAAAFFAKDISPK